MTKTWSPSLAGLGPLLNQGRLTIYINSTICSNTMSISSSVGEHCKYFVYTSSRTLWPTISEPEEELVNLLVEVAMGVAK